MKTVTVSLTKSYCVREPDLGQLSEAEIAVLGAWLQRQLERAIDRQLQALAREPQRPRARGAGFCLARS